MSAGASVMSNENGAVAAAVESFSELSTSVQPATPTAVTPAENARKRRRFTERFEVLDRIVVLLKTGLCIKGEFPHSYFRRVIPNAIGFASSCPFDRAY